MSQYSGIRFYFLVLFHRAGELEGQEHQSETASFILSCLVQCPVLFLFFPGPFVAPMLLEGVHYESARWCESIAA